MNEKLMHVVVLDFNYKEISWDVDVTEDHTSHGFVEAISIGLD